MRSKTLRAAAAPLIFVLAALPLACSGSGEKVSLRVSPTAELKVAASWDRIAEYSMDIHERFPSYFKYVPAEPERTYRGEEFAAFLPSEPVALGEIWPLDMERVIGFWHQFDPSARTRLHHGRTGEGGFACLRAYDDAEAEVIFRTHGEFALDEGHVAYTPGQLSGRLVLDRRTGEPKHFRMALPTDRKPNVVTDVGYEAEIEKDGVKKKVMQFDADIVFVPRMELVGGAASRPEGDMGWSRCVDEAKARLEMKARFYKSDQIEWLSVDDAARRSKETGKPIHLIAMFGALDDESC